MYTIQPNYDGMLAAHLNKISAEQAEESHIEAETRRLEEECGERIIQAWVDADDLCFEDYQKTTQADFAEFIDDCLSIWGEERLPLNIPMPTWAEYQARKQRAA